MLVVGCIFVEVPLVVETTVALTVVGVSVIGDAGVGVPVFGEILEVVSNVESVGIKDTLPLEHSRLLNVTKCDTKYILIKKCLTLSFVKRELITSQ